VDLKNIIRDVPDFPKPGIIFKDITTLLKDKEAFRLVVNQMAERYGHQSIQKVVGIESRGFIFGGALAYLLGCGFVPARKPNKLPYERISENYDLEYGSNTLELHTDAIMAGEAVVLVDDLLATGGTALAVLNLIERLQGRVMGMEFLIELEFLQGRKQLNNYPVHSLICY
jgi:adenine phosphoribosyltransferase